MERKNLETERGNDVEDVELSQPQTQYMVVDIGGEVLVLLRVISTRHLIVNLTVKPGFSIF